MNLPTIPTARFRDYVLAVFAAVLLFSWLVGLANGVAQLFGRETASPLVVALAATVGYFGTLQLIMQRSQYVTYLWLRHIQGRQFQRS